jgi:hypothetical protein
VPAVSGDFSCVGSVTWPAPTSATAVVKFSMASLTSGNPVEGLAVRACPAGDVDCANPIPGASGTTDANGSVDITVPTGTAGFDGYFEVTKDNELTHLVHFRKPVAADQSEGRILTTISALNTLVSSVGLSLDMTYGFLGVEAQDCVGAFADGISFELDPPDPHASLAYVTPQGVSLTAGGSSAAGHGLAGFVNVTPGSYTVITRIAATGQVTGRLPVVVRAGAASAISDPPTPLPLHPACRA